MQERRRRNAKKVKEETAKNAKGQSKTKHRPYSRLGGKVTREVEEVNAGSVDTVFVDLGKDQSGHGMLSNAIGELTKCEATQLENNAR